MHSSKMLSAASREGGVGRGRGCLPGGVCLERVCPCGQNDGHV